MEKKLESDFYSKYNLFVDNHDLKTYSKKNFIYICWKKNDNLYILFIYQTI